MRHITIGISSIAILLLITQVSFQMDWPSSPSAPSAISAVPSDSAPRNTLIGLHTRLTDEPDPAKIDRTFGMLRDMGATWVVEYFPWDHLQPKGPDHYDWSHSDLVISEARRHNLKLIARVDGVPAWARPPGTTAKYLGEDRYVDFANFVAAFARRYQGSVAYIVLWNEPNLSFEWGFRPVEPEAYVRLLEAVHSAVKRTAPSAQLAFAGLAPTLEPPGSTVGLNDLIYFDRALKAGAAKFVDAFAAHSYGLNSAPEDPPAPDRINFRRVELLYQLAQHHGAGDKPILITEGGWNDSKRWLYGLSPSQRIRFTIRAYAMAHESWLWLKAMCLWVFRFYKPTYTYQDGYTFVDDDFTPKPIYDAVRAYSLGQAP
jgi:hypothetical protein